MTIAPETVQPPEVEQKKKEVHLNELPPGTLKRLLRLVALRMHRAVGFPTNAWNVILERDDKTNSAQMLATFDYVDEKSMEVMVLLAKKMQARVNIFHEKEGVSVSFIWMIEPRVLENELKAALVDPDLPYKHIKLKKDQVDWANRVGQDIDRVIISQMMRRFTPTEHFDVGIATLHVVESFDLIGALKQGGLKAARVELTDGLTKHEVLCDVTVVTSDLSVFQMANPGAMEYQERESHCINRTASANLIHNRYYYTEFLRKHGSGINRPPSVTFDDKERLRAFLLANSEKSYAVKEHIHQGGGQTTIKLHGDLTGDQEHVLLRMRSDYPIIVEDWLPHRPSTDYLRLMTLGENQFAKVPQDGSPLTHGQQARKFVSLKSIPKEVQEQGFRLNDIFELEYNSTDLSGVEGLGTSLTRMRGGQMSMTTSTSRRPGMEMPGLHWSRNT